MNAPPTTPPGAKELRSFGLIMGGIIAALFGLLIPWLFDHAWPLWPWIVAGAFALVALAYPPALAPVYRGWMAFGRIAGAINTRIILAILFYGMLLPIGFVLRLFGRDPMFRRYDPRAETYRVASRRRERNHPERPF
ncbi:MAG: hypothetical protein KDG50_01390 [Chromatiales bacterium]|nr:hypothetical protein [Chromatiales bacterium]